MTNTVEVDGIQTSLKNQKQFGLDVLLISTSLLLINGIDQDQASKKLIEKQKYYGRLMHSTRNSISILDPNYSSMTSGTTIDFCPPTFSFANTTLWNDYEQDAEDDELFIVPKYNKEFKIKVASLKIDRSLPNIFID